MAKGCDCDCCGGGGCCWERRDVAGREQPTCFARYEGVSRRESQTVMREHFGPLAVGSADGRAGCAGASW